MPEKVIRRDYTKWESRYSRFYVFEEREMSLDEYIDILIIDVPHRITPMNNIDVFYDKVNSFMLEKIGTGSDWHALWGTLPEADSVEEVDINSSTLRTMLNVYKSIKSVLDNHQKWIADYLEIGKD